MNPDLERVHTQTLGQIARDEASVRRIHAEAIRSVRDGRATPLQAAARAEAQMVDVLQRGIRQALRRQYRWLNSQRLSLGFARLSRQAINDAVEAALTNYVDRPFPGTAFSSRDRARVLAYRLMQGLEEVDAAATPAARRAIAAELVAQHARAAGGSGASNSAQIRRIARTEYLRAQRDASAAVFASMGTRYVYWRLSPAHKWQGGTEICEVMAAREIADPNVPDGMDRAGLYLATSVPASPHPHCMCYVEPAYPPGFGGSYQKALIEGQATFSAVSPSDRVDSIPLSDRAAISASTMAAIGRQTAPYVAAQQVRSAAGNEGIIDDPMYRSYDELVAALGLTAARDLLDDLSEDTGSDLTWVANSNMRWVPLVALLEDTRAVG